MWIADHFGYSKVSGKFTDISGEIVFDEKKPQDSSVQVEIKTDSIATGLPKFEEHLKSKDFFDVKTFPTAKFVSKKIIVEGKKNKAQIIGDLTLLGVTKEVVLKAEFNKSAPNPMSQKPTIGFSAKTSINRSDFGIKYALPGIADKIELVIEVEANR
jgi:polyisoprenoid-binding protein YceI